MLKQGKFTIEILLVFAMIAVLFYNLGFMPLSADEPIRAIVALDMDLNGHFLAPEINGDSYLNKPPLYNWILYLLFKITGNYSEWLIRLPSIIPLIFFLPIIFWVSNKYLKDVRLSLLTSLAFVTTGNLLFYSSYLGHIDVLFSLITFLQIYVIIELSRKQRWFMCFALSYFLAVIGFLMKGLPSIPFQGITLLTCFLLNKNFKKLFSVQHLLGSFFFVVPLLLYLYAFNQKGNAFALLERLVSESASRTVTDKSFIESVLHLFTFPVLFLLDIMPWGFLLLVFIRKDVRQNIWSNLFYKNCLWVFGANILIYWLSPDYRARYVFMLIPFLLIPCMAGLKIIADKIPNLWFRIGLILTFAALVSFGLLYFMDAANEAIKVPTYFYFIAFPMIVLLSYFAFKTMKNKDGKGIVTTMVGFLIFMRFAHAAIVVPQNVAGGAYQLEKNQALEITTIVGKQPLYMYQSNVSLTMNWYVSAMRKEMLITHRSDFQMDAFYLIPTEILLDPDNVHEYYTFVRRYEEKPISLVKFKHYFPEMLK